MTDHKIIFTERSWSGAYWSSLTVEQDDPQQYCKDNGGLFLNQLTEWVIQTTPVDTRLITEDAIRPMTNKGEKTMKRRTLEEHIAYANKFLDPDKKLTPEGEEFIRLREQWVANSGCVMAGNPETNKVPKNGRDKASRVVVMCKAESKALGWRDTWNDHMDKYVGETGIVLFDDDILGILVEMPDGIVCSFPPWVLAVVKDEK